MAFILGVTVFAASTLARRRPHKTEQIHQVCRELKIIVHDAFTARMTAQLGGCNIGYLAVEQRLSLLRIDRLRTHCASTASHAAKPEV